MSRSIWRPAPQPRRKILAFRNAASFGLGYWRGINSANSGVTTPDHASLDILGDLDIRALVNPDAGWGTAVNFTILAKRNTAGTSGQAYKLDHFESAGSNFLQLAWNVNTTTEIVVNSTDETDFLTGAAWVRATLDVDNGAGGYEVKFYTSSDPIDTDPASVTWAQLGTTITGGATTSIQNTASPVTLGAYDLDDGGANRFIGRFHYAEIRSGIGGTVVADPDFRWRTDYDSPTQLTDGAGRVWTIQSPAWWVLPLQGEEPESANQIDLNHIGPTAVVNAPVQVSGSIANNHIGPVGVVNAPQVNGSITGAHIGPISVVNAPQINGRIVNAHIGPTGVVNQPAVVGSIGINHIGPVGVLNAPTLNGRIVNGHIGPVAALSAPQVNGQIQLTHIGPTSVVNAVAVGAVITLSHIGPVAVLNAIKLFKSFAQSPVAIISNDGWDTGPSPGGDLDAALVSEDSDYITVTV